jgi:hypothetical protein
LEQALQAELNLTNGAIDYLARTIERFPSPPPAWPAVLATERRHLAELADRMVTHQSRVEDVQAEVRGQVLDQLQMALIGILTDLWHDPDSDVCARSWRFSSAGRLGLRRGPRHPLRPVRRFIRQSSRRSCERLVAIKGGTRPC